MKPRFADDDPPPQSQPQPYRSILDTLSLKKPARKSDWDKKHAPKAYNIPAPLIGIAQEIRTKILSRANFDEDGRRRTLSADIVAKVILEWAIAQYTRNPSLIQASPTPRAKGGLTAFAAPWNKGEHPPVYPEVRNRRKNTQKNSKYVLSYRLPESIEKFIQDIANEKGVPLGEVFLRLLQIGLAGHDAMKYVIQPSAEVVFNDATYREANNE